MYYTVRIDKKDWTNETITLEEVEAKGFQVQPSRRIGDYDVFYEGKKVSTLFSDKKEAARYALEM